MIIALSVIRVKLYLLANAIVSVINRMNTEMLMVVANLAIQVARLAHQALMIVAYPVTLKNN